MKRLTGKVAWVTGAGSGIGEAGALALVGEGASVILTGRRKEPLDTVGARVEKSGGTARVHQGDMSRAEDAPRIAEAIEKEFGRLDILVNNAGSNIPDRSWKKLTAAGAEELIRANLSSAFHGAIAALPIMRKQKDGVIINIASIAGRFVSTQPGVGYIAAKHGVVALSHSINMEECRNGIRSTAFSPGEVATPRSSPSVRFPSATRTRRGCCNPRTSAISFATSPACRPACASTTF
jgi:NAD(P)-dependent dehydrogenase (short-subunit alcohol dehydrogenase family)